jgi:hypothetical protein
MKWASIMPKTIRANVDKQTTERLLDAAERLFAEHGYDGVGMRALAEEAGVNLGAALHRDVHAAVSSDQCQANGAAPQSRSRGQRWPGGR